LRFTRGSALWATVEALLKATPIAGIRVNPAEQRRHHALADSLLAALCSYLLAPSSDNGSETGFSGEKRHGGSISASVDAELRACGGRPVQVTEIAARLGLSPGHLSERIRKERGMPLKTYIDLSRYREIERLLLYADAPIKLVAAQTGFRDLYSFSRFVKRISGHSPRSVRAAHLSKPA
jgi:AraC-like DNA-binding protein